MAVALSEWISKRSLLSPNKVKKQSELIISYCLNCPNLSAMKIRTLFYLFVFVPCIVFSQKTFSRQDSLRGSINPNRAWWNVLKYDIAVQPDYNQKTIHGTTTITFNTLKAAQVMQIDLQEPMQIDTILYQGNLVSFKRQGNSFLVDL